jgi:endonuclease YncB( thermonuclease family)
VSLWCRRVVVNRVVDGDTIDLEWIDQGFGDFKMGVPPREADPGDPLRFRLAAVNAYEKTLRGGTTPEEKALGIEATAWLKGVIEGRKAKIKSIVSFRKGNFGRYLVYLFLDGPDDEHLDPLDGAKCINRMLLDEGYAVVSKYDDGDTYDGLGYEREE